MKKLLEIAIKAAVEAGEEIMKIYEGDDFHIQFKGDASPLTIADEKSNEVINDYLLKTEVPIISEENAQISFEKRKHWTSCWIVDPLDGTKEFIKRNGEFTVNIAYVENGKPVLGVVYIPVEKKLYYADVEERSAYSLIIESNFNEKQLNHGIRISSSRSNNNKIRVVGSRSHMNDDTKTYIQNIESMGKEVEIISKGSSLKFCLVAEGKADVYPRFAPTMEWDTAAAQAICNAVGVSVISQETNQQLKYNKENLLNPWFLVSK